MIMQRNTLSISIFVEIKTTIYYLIYSNSHQSSITHHTVYMASTGKAGGEGNAGEEGLVGVFASTTKAW